MRFIIAAALMCLTAVPVSAEMTPYREVGGWSVMRGEGSCGMTASFTGKGGSESVLMAFYDDRLERATVAFGDPSIKSLKVGDKRKVKTYFITGGEMDDGWGERTFTVSKVGEIVYFGAVFDDQFLIDLSRSSSLGFFFGDVLLQSYDLTGTIPAVAALRECARSERHRNPTDPFANEK